MKGVKEVKTHAVVAILALAVTAACAAAGGLRRSSVSDLLAAFDAGRTRVEFHAGVVEKVVLGANLEASTRTALTRAGRGIPVGEVPSSSAMSLPAKHFLLKGLRLDKDTGRMIGTVGPVSAPISMGACGSTFELSLERAAGSWHAKVVGVTVC